MRRKRLGSIVDQSLGSSLPPTNPIEFTGVRLSMEQGDKVDSYYIDHNEAIAKILIEHDLSR